MRLFDDFQALPDEIRGCAVAIGNFDGVHLGHREVIGEAGRIAAADGLPWAVMTFEPHPRRIFQPDVAPFRLTPAPVKQRLIAALGPNALIIVPFTVEFSRLAARAFVESVLVKGLGARHVVCGHDFAFGHGRRGTPEMLLWLGDEYSFGFTCVQEVRDAAAESYSSTRVRGLLRAGDPRGAARLLGRPFEIEGPVIAGEQRGRRLGFPTANLALGEYVRPRNGVYAARIGWREGDFRYWRDAVANLGVRPTFGEGDVLLETHAFDFAGDLYDRPVRVQLIDFLRPEKKFDGLEHLRAQIAEDCLDARRVLSAERAA